MTESYIPRLKLPFSASYQCEHEWHIPGYAIECHMPCDKDKRYCVLHMKEHENEDNLVDEEKDMPEHASLI